VGEREREEFFRISISTHIIFKTLSFQTGMVRGVPVGVSAWEGQYMHICRITLNLGCISC
jgi:hypothetical protein